MEKSSQQRKKWMVKSPSGKIIHFGDPYYEDYTQHKDETRRKNYCSRAMAILDKHGALTWQNKESANYYSTHLLWLCHKLK